MAAKGIFRNVAWLRLSPTKAGLFQRIIRALGYQTLID